MFAGTKRRFADRSVPSPTARQLLVFAVLTGLILAAAASILHYYEQRVRLEVFSNLQAIARLKTQEIESWMAERRGDAIAIQQDPLLATVIAEYLGSGGVRGEEQLRRRLQGLAEAYRYQNILLFDADAQARLILNAKAPTLDAWLVDRVRTAIAGDQIEVTDLHESGLSIHLDVVAPIARAGGGDAGVVGVLVLIVDPHRFLYPRIQTWPVASTSAESLLVRREGTDILYLNQLRHYKGSALRMRRPLNDPILPAAVSLNTGAPTLDGRDYRGVPVLAAMRPVRGTPWHLVAKIDTSEALNVFRELTAWVLIITVATIVGAAAVLRRFWRHQARAIDAERRAHQAESAAIEKITPVGIFRTDLLGRYVSVNERWCVITGIRSAEALADGWLKAVHPDDVERVRGEWEQFVALHTLFLSEFRYVRGNGLVTWVLVQAVPESDTHDNAIGYIGAVTGINVLKEMQTDLRAANDKLRDQLQDIERLRAALQEQVIRDPLTGLHNRRYMEETLGHEFARAAREQYPISVVMIDIDHFKNVNDTYAHAVGDQVLRAIAYLLHGQMRGSDILIRYGGEELLAILPKAPVEFAIERAGQWREAVESMRIVHDDTALKVTVSLGVAAYPEHGDKPEVVLKAADQALYSAKNSGRNRVAGAATPSPPASSTTLTPVGRADGGGWRPKL